MTRIKLTIYTISFLLLGTLTGCEDPLNGFDLQISPTTFKNYKILRVIDIGGNAVPRAAVALSAGDTQDLYNQEGYKDFKLQKSMVVFCLDPKRSPTEQNPVRFQVSIAAAGYVSQQVPLTIAGESTNVQTVVLKKSASTKSS